MFADFATPIPPKVFIEPLLEFDESVVELTVSDDPILTAPPTPKPPTAVIAPVVVEVDAVVLLVDMMVVNVEPPAPPVTFSRPPENDRPVPI